MQIRMPQKFAFTVLFTLAILGGFAKAVRPCRFPRTSHQTPSAPASQTGCETQLLPAQLQELKQQIRGGLVSIRDQMEEVVNGTLKGTAGPASRIGIYAGNFSTVDANRQNQSIAESWHIFYCFVEPLADAQKNETLRNLTERQAISYNNQFYATNGNLVSVADGIYKLVKGDRFINSCNIPHFNDTCPKPQLNSLGNRNSTVRQQRLSAVSDELRRLADDLLKMRVFTGLGE